MPEPHLPALVPFPISPLPSSKWIDGLLPEMSSREALLQILNRRWESVRYYLPLAAQHADETIEHVHQLRVSTRRLGVILGLLSQITSGEELLKASRTTRRIRKQCGKARDLDVQLLFLETLLLHAGTDELTAIELLREEIREKRRKQQKRLRTGLPELQRKLEKHCRRLIAVIESPAAVENDHETFASLGTRHLAEQMTELWSHSPREFKSPAELHELRIACKHLRYATEVFAPILHESFRDEFYPLLQTIQDQLGTCHDAHQALLEMDTQRPHWKQLCKNGLRCTGLGRVRWREFRIGWEAIRLAEVHREEQARVEFLELWPDFAGKSFRIPVEEMLAARQRDLIPAAENQYNTAPAEGT